MQQKVWISQDYAGKFFLSEVQKNTAGGGGAVRPHPSRIGSTKSETQVVNMSALRFSVTLVLLSLLLLFFTNSVFFYRLILYIYGS